jgi:predicted amidohydrolase YtcJ
MKHSAALLLACAMLASCMKGKAVDIIVHNARIHTMDDKSSVAEAMAIRDGKIVETGPERQIMNKYRAEEFIDAGKKDIFPGFTDAHGHIMSYARQKLSADLTGSRSFKEMLVRVEKYGQRGERSFISGRGWDQSLWNGEMPSNEELDRLFSDKPVLLHRIDGHAALANSRALALAGISPQTKVEGGSIGVKDGKCTGLLLDNAITMVSEKLPDFLQNELMEAIDEIQFELLQYGITCVHEAGVSYKDLQLLREMSAAGKLKIELYVMLFPTKENIAFAKKHGKLKEGKLTVRSFKVIGDGALGSHGALMKKPYSDEAHNGLLTTSVEELRRVAGIAAAIDYQVNIHAIGDSTNRIALGIINEYKAMKPDHRWRIEHAQIVDPADLALFSESGAFPSVQPVHAVSDSRWVERRIGPARMKGAYAYRSLLLDRAMLAIGTDFPVESPNPFLTIHAAVNRTDAEGRPIGGFMPEEALTADECLRGMTIWAAFASFSENRGGSLEKGKEATFVILSRPFTTGPQFAQNYAGKVFVKGKPIYESAAD